MWLERSRDDPAVVLSIVDSVSLSGLRAASKVAPRSGVVGGVDAVSVLLISRSFLTSNRTLVFSSMYALTSCKASVNAFSSGGVGESADAGACFGSSGVAAAGVAWGSGEGEETGLGGAALSSDVVVGGGSRGREWWVSCFHRGFTLRFLGIGCANRLGCTSLEFRGWLGSWFRGSRGGWCCRSRGGARGSTG